MNQHREPATTNPMLGTQVPNHISRMRVTAVRRDGASSSQLVDALDGIDANDIQGPFESNDRVDAVRGPHRLGDDV